eukprot:gene28584-35467_t
MSLTELGMETGDTLVAMWKRTGRPALGFNNDNANSSGDNSNIGFANGNKLPLKRSISDESSERSHSDSVNSPVATAAVRACHRSTPQWVTSSSSTAAASTSGKTKRSEPTSARKVASSSPLYASEDYYAFDQGDSAWDDDHLCNVGGMDDFVPGYEYYPYANENEEEQEVMASNDDGQSQAAQVATSGDFHSVEDVAGSTSSMPVVVSKRIDFEAVAAGSSSSSSLPLSSQRMLPFDSSQVVDMLSDSDDEARRKVSRDRQAKEAMSPVERKREEQTRRLQEFVPFGSLQQQSPVTHTASSSSSSHSKSIFSNLLRNVTNSNSNSSHSHISISSSTVDSAPLRVTPVAAVRSSQQSHEVHSLLDDDDKEEDIDMEEKDEESITLSKDPSSLNAGDDFVVDDDGSDNEEVVEEVTTQSATAITAARPPVAKTPHSGEVVDLLSSDDEERADSDGEVEIDSGTCNYVYSSSVSSHADRAYEDLCSSSSSSSSSFNRAALTSSSQLVQPPRGSSNLLSSLNAAVSRSSTASSTIVSNRPVEVPVQATVVLAAKIPKPRAKKAAAADSSTSGIATDKPAAARKPKATKAAKAVATTSTSASSVSVATSDPFRPFSNNTAEANSSVRISTSTSSSSSSSGFFRAEVFPTNPTIQTTLSTMSSMERVETTLSSAVDWEVVLIVDKREQNNPHIQTRMVELNIPCELSTLAVGDFLWVARPKQQTSSSSGTALHRSVSNCNNNNSSSSSTGNGYVGMQALPPDENSNESASSGLDGETTVDPRDFYAVVLDCIAERKSVSDLASSILDQRYHEQKSRLRATGVRSQIYIVEGEIVLNIKQKAITPQHIKTCISATHAENAMHVMRTRCMEHTITSLIALHWQVVRRFRKAPADQLYQTFPNFQKLYGKKSASTYGQLFGHQLRQVQGCSKHAALALMREFGTTSNFVSELDRMGKLSATKKIADMLKVGSNREGNDRRIGKALAERIWN